MAAQVKHTTSANDSGFAFLPSPVDHAATSSDLHVSEQAPRCLPLAQCGIASTTDCGQSMERDGLANGSVATEGKSASLYVKHGKIYHVDTSCVLPSPCLTIDLTDILDHQILEILVPL